jgi:SAM-dependent methyltransferase
VLATSRRQFVDDYARIRTAEGRGSGDSAYYRALPYSDTTGKNAGQWRIRARSFDYLVARVLPRRPADILDVGAGNCWMSYRLAQMKHRPVAVDIFSDERDGLRCRRHYPCSFPAVEADFDNLPFAAESFDLVIFNSSIHYSPDYTRTLAQTRQALRPKGRIVIVDSPVYQRREHGERMRAERHSYFEKQYGFRSDAIPSIEFFDLEMIDELSHRLSLRWTIHRPWYGLGWHLRPLKAHLQKRRPPSRFWILVGQFR